MAEVKVGPTMHVICLYSQKVYIVIRTFWKFKYITKVLQVHKYVIIKKKAQGTRVADVEVGPMNMIFLVFNFLDNHKHIVS